jgi:hypothetical protein
LLTATAAARDRASLQRRYLIEFDDALLGTYTTVSKSQWFLLDFSKVEYINSSGIAGDPDVDGKEQNGQKIAAFGLTPHFRGSSMVGITKYASLYPDEGTARTSI